MSTPNGEPQNPYTSGQPGQGQNQHYGQNRQYQQPQYPQPNYQQSPYQNSQYSGYPSQAQYQGSQLAQTSMILGIVSIFVLGIILGPIAIVKANQAERDFNTSATAGKVTGWIGAIFGLIYLIIFIGTMLLAFLAPEATYSTQDF